MGKKHLAGIILRLTDEERDLLKIFNAALKVSEYTDDVDNVRLTHRRDQIMINAMVELFTTLAGLSVISNDLPPKVREQLKNREVEVSVLEPVLQRFFEIGRRFKRLNPDRMRSEYGKMVMLLQDMARPGVQTAMRMNLVQPIKTVGSALRQIGAEDLMSEDALLNLAVMPLPAGYSAEQSETKKKAFAELVKKYSDDGTSEEKARVVDLCLRSIDDAVSMVEGNRGIIKKVIGWLDQYFKPGVGSTNMHDLTIRRGQGTAQLTHSHSEQYAYVRESLVLWDIVQRDIFSFWQCVEDDMLVSNPSYQMMNTGQGVHRVSSGPKTYSQMASAVSEADRSVGGWVGIKVIHLGDRDVPNPLVFIDKYTIVPRLLGPIVQVVEEIMLEFGVCTEARPERFPGFRQLLLTGVDDPQKLIMTILRDFFRYGFDGSGDDGGSCIDGRLTSAWNWCSELHKKPFYQAFQLCGFTGFDANYEG